MKRNGLVIILLFLLLAVPATAQLPVCSGTVVSISSEDCENHGVTLGWTAQPGAAGYTVCLDDALLACTDNGYSTSIGMAGTGTVHVRVFPYDAGGRMCESTMVEVSPPDRCVPAPEFPSLFFPAAMVTGFLGAAMYIRKTISR